MITVPKVVLITGSSAGGIGGALCEEYARAGCIVYASARRLEAMDGLDVTGDIRKIKLDVNDPQNIDEAVQTIINAEGRIDILVNNAGVLAVGPVLDVSINEVQSAFATNFFSVLRLTQVVVPHMASRSIQGTKGLVINIGSVTAAVPAPWGGIYASTKAALRSVSETMYMEFQPIGVGVLLVEPGGIRSNLSTNYEPRYRLPESSLYKAYIKRILARIHASQAPGAMDTNAFALSVVRASLPPPSALARLGLNAATWSPQWYLSTGKLSTWFWLLSWLPRTIALGAMWNAIGKLEK